MTFFAGGVTGEVSDTWLSIKFELRKHLRRKRLLIVTALAIVVPLIFYIIPRIEDVDFGASASSFAANTLGFLNVLIIISAALFAGDAICGEFEKKTGLLLFPTTQSRASIFIGKYIAALLATFLVVSLYCVVTTLEIMVVYGAGEIPAELAESYLLALLFTTSAVSVVYFLSSILKRAISSTILGFVLLMMVMHVIQNVLWLVDVEPWFIVTYSAELITERLGEVSFGPGGHDEFDSASFSPDLYVGIGVMIAYTLVLFLSSIVIANRRSME
jgi:ABC-type transport system involved in multi-copper enzyme maturation permease subunit